MVNQSKFVVTEIIRNQFGPGRNVVHVEPWGGGAHNRCFKAGIDNPKCDVFIKIEKEEIFPRTRRCQIEREVYGNRLADSAGVPCPKILGYSFDDRSARYILQEFIDGKLMGEGMNEFSEEEKQQSALAIRKIADRLQNTRFDMFGEVFAGGVLLQHRTWNGMMAHLSSILMEDARTLDVFSNDEIDIIMEAHILALQSIGYSGPSCMVHLDLHEFNIFSDKDCRTAVSIVIDFGFVLLMAPYVSYYGPQAFEGNEEELSRMFHVSPEELKAFDLIFSLEFAVFAAGIRFAPDEPYGYLARKREYIEKCRAYIIGLQGKKTGGT